MQFQKAQLAALDAVTGIIRQAQARLKALGVDQWQDGYPNAAVIRRDIEAGEGYLLCEDGWILAFCAVCFAGEPSYDRIYNGDWHGNAPYAVVHRLAADEGCCRRGAGSELLRQAGRLCRAKGVGWLRADTHSDNLPMHRLLAKNGFSPCGTILLENGAPRVAFDRKLTE